MHWLFFVAAWSLIRAFQGRHAGRDILAGALIGLTFLAHTAPALILAVGALLSAFLSPVLSVDPAPAARYWWKLFLSMSAATLRRSTASGVEP